MISQLKNINLSWIASLTKQYPSSEVYLVGGAVRDFLMGRGTADLDFVVRNVEADKLEKFLNENGKVDFVGKSFGVYKFRPTPANKDDEVVVDIALPRTEHSFNTGGYRDVKVDFNHTLEIERDLERRDFTINAIALKISFVKNEPTTSIINPFGGQKDLEKRIIRTVGDSQERFQEDATRMLRAIRFVCQLSASDNVFAFDSALIKAIKQKKDLIKKIAPDRIGEELNKIIATFNAELGFRLLHEFGLLDIIMPELVNCFGVDQSRNHIYNVFEHSLRSLGFAAKNNYSLEIRWAAMLHDIGKPQTKRKQGDIYTFYNHEKVGSNLVRKMLRRLRFPEQSVHKICHLISKHMFYYNISEITDSAVRRLIHKVGEQNIEDLINLRIADRLGMGRPKAKPFKLIELERRIKEVSLDPLSVLMLKINGEDVMKETGLKPGTKIGWMMKALLAEILEEPAKNKREYLLTKLKELNKLSEEELKKLSPDLDYYEEKRREKYIGKPLVFRGKRLERRVRKIVH